MKKRLKDKQIVIAANLYSLLLDLLMFNKEDIVLFIQMPFGSRVPYKLKKHGYTTFCYYRLYSKSEFLNYI